MLPGHGIKGVVLTFVVNGGPGCSSLQGFLSENGPINWLAGTLEPTPNPYSWTNLTNVVWVDQPVGTGLGSFAPDYPATITNEVDVGRDFAGFWKNFIETFGLQHKKIYVTGESYAGYYIPYIASEVRLSRHVDIVARRC